jgi:CheY-like chemotaxis protein
MHLSGHPALIIDHRSTSRMVLTGIVRGIDSQIVVEEKPDANGAIAWTKDNSPSLVVSDYQMPEKDGIRLIRQLRELPPCALVPIICSNRRSGKSGARAGPGASDFLTKPVGSAECRLRSRNLFVIQRIALFARHMSRIWSRRSKR